MRSLSHAVIGIDQSTSATKAVVFDLRGVPITEMAVGHASAYPRPGWVEQDPLVLVTNVLEILTKLMGEATALGYQVQALGLSNQRETVVVWERATGKPLHPAMGWQCLRGQDITARWRNLGHAEAVLASTGLPLDPHFSASKVAWVLENVEGARQAADQGRLAFGTVDSWLIWNLTGGQVHATDPSNASRTLLYNLATGSWDQDLMKTLGIPLSMAPEIRMSDAYFGETSLGGTLADAVPIRGVLGDSHAALFGLKCFSPGQAKATFGTGSSVMLNLGTRLPEGIDGVVATSVAWGLGGQTSFVLEGNIHHSGDTLKWLIEDLGLFGSMEELQALASSTPGTDGVYLVPGFSGLGAPHWDDEARGSIIGLVRGSTKAQLARAGLESLAYQVVDLLQAMRRVSPSAIEVLAVDGGPTKNPQLMQFLANMGSVEIAVPTAPNASVFGVALMAGLSCGLWKDLGALETLGDPGTRYQPRLDDAQRRLLWEGWERAVEKTRFRSSSD